FNPDHSRLLELKAFPLLRALHLDPTGAVHGEGTTLRWRFRVQPPGGLETRRPIHHYFVDVNGDGLADDVVTVELVDGGGQDGLDSPPRTSRPFIILNTGHGFGEVNEALLEPTSTPLQGLLERWQITEDQLGGNVQVMDLDQDGRQDLLL